MIQTILFATDLGVYTPFILPHVTSLASHCDARIVVVHAVEPLGTLGRTLVKTYLPKQTSQHITQAGVDLVIQSIRERVIDLLADDFIEAAGGLHQVKEVVVDAGRPADVILKHAATQQVDLIVVGSHGPGPGMGVSMGSVAARVLQMAKVPVYVVPVLSKSPMEETPPASNGWAN